MLKLFLSNLLNMLAVIGLAVLLLAMGVIIIAALFALIAFVLTGQTISLAGWLIVTLCIPCAALMKTISDIQSG